MLAGVMVTPKFPHQDLRGSPWDWSLQDLVCVSPGPLLDLHVPHARP